MKLFRRPQPEKLFAPGHAARELMAFAKVGLTPCNLELITADPETRNAISSLVYLTKTALIIGFLRDEAQNKPPDSRQYQFVDSFEGLAFADTPFDAYSELAACFANLFMLATALDDIMSTANEHQTRSAIPEWCASWLNTISDNKDFINRTSLIFGGELSIYLHEQMRAIHKLVKISLYQEHKEGHL